MDILDRLLAHDTWTTRQLLEACQELPDKLLDKEFEIDHRSLRATFVHFIVNMEIWTDLLCERPIQSRTGKSIPELIERLGIISRDFADVSRRVAREGRYDDTYVDPDEDPPVRRDVRRLDRTRHHTQHAPSSADDVPDGEGRYRGAHRGRFVELGGHQPRVGRLTGRLAVSRQRLDSTAKQADTQVCPYVEAISADPDAAP